jgi:hypothetical protein
VAVKIEDMKNMKRLMQLTGAFLGLSTLASARPNLRDTPQVWLASNLIRS